jgi:hypothetical protein
MCLMDSTLMGAQQPPFQQRYHPMYTGKKVLTFWLTALHAPIVDIILQPQVSSQSVCSHGATGFKRVGDEAVQTGLGQVGDVPHSDTANTRSIFLSCDDDYGLVLRQSSDDIFLLAAPVGFIHFDRSSQTIPTWPHHGSTEFVQPCPRRHVAPQAEHLLQAHCAGSVLLAGNMPDRPEPHPQRLSRVLKNRPRSHRTLIATCSTNQSPPRCRPVSPGAASGANKAFRPSELNQVIPTGTLGRKPFLKFQDRPRVVFHTRINTSCHRWSQLNNPIEK